MGVCSLKRGQNSSDFSFQGGAVCSPSDVVSPHHPLVRLSASKGQMRGFTAVFKSVFSQFTNCRVFISSWSCPVRPPSSGWSEYSSSLCPPGRSLQHSPASCYCRKKEVSVTGAHEEMSLSGAFNKRRPLWLNLLDEASMAVVLDIFLPLLLLLLLSLVSFHIILSVLLPLLGLVHHLTPLLLQFLRRELPTSGTATQNMIRFSGGGDNDKTHNNWQYFSGPKEFVKVWNINCTAAWFLAHVLTF